MLTIETAMDDSDRLVNSLVMVTERGGTDTNNLLMNKEAAKERTEPKKKPQAGIQYFLAKMTTSCSC